MHTPEQARCVFHPNRAAVAKCEKCSNMVCLECKKTYRVRRTSKGDSVYNFCPPCHQTFGRRRKWGSIIAVVFFVVVAILMINWFITQSSNMPTIPEFP